jgi:hypothetical protein
MDFSPLLLLRCDETARPRTEVRSTEICGGLEPFCPWWIANHRECCDKTGTRKSHFDRSLFTICAGAKPAYQPKLPPNHPNEDVNDAE